jgi:hypothetical protein
MALCILHILPNANCPNTCFRLHVVMRRMPRIDPSQLLTTLSVLLAPDGGIRSADDVSILLLITSYSLTYSLTYSLHFPYLLSPCFITVADRGCSSRIQSFPSRIQGQKDPGSASNNLSTLTKTSFLSSRNYDPNCSSRIRIRIWIFYPSRIQGSKRYLPDPGSGSATPLFINRPLRVYHSPFNFGVLVHSCCLVVCLLLFFNLPFSSLPLLSLFS